MEWLPVSIRCLLREMAGSCWPAFGFRDKCPMACFFMYFLMIDCGQVIDCADWTSSTMSQEAFFKHYQTWDPETPCENLKLKDFPPEGLFRDSLQRHHQVLQGNS